MDSLWKESKRNWGVYFFVLPALVIFLIFGLYPFIETFKISFFEWDGIARNPTFVGFYNYIDIFTKNKVWWSSVWHAVFIAVFALTIQNSVALFLAVLIYRDIRAKRFYRVVFYIPPVLSLIVVGLIWRFIYNNEYGILNHWLNMVGLENLARPWLADPKTALICIAVVQSWQGLGNAFLLFYAGLQVIPEELFEAAHVDGANAWRRFIHITVPSLIPVSTLVTILTLLGTMQTFPLVISMTNGGPGFHTEVPVTRIYKMAFESYHFGYATAEAVVLGVMLLILSLIQLRISRKMDSR
ncbi:sugar ABC transporter permease [bacterium]|nr:sugar ABC transporter permease [bacterium]